MAKILFLTTAIEHTTYRKTAKMLQNEGAEVQLLGFTRKNYPVTQKDSLSVKNLGKLSHGNYLSRLVRLVKTVPRIRKEANKYEVIYNFTLDTFLMSRIALLFKKKTWVYQIQDIRPIYFGDSWKNKLMRGLEKRFIRKADLLVVSSENYFTDHFKPLYGVDKSKVQVIENKLVKGSIAPEKRPKIQRRDKITLGYFGVLRCERSWMILKNAALKEPHQLFLYLRGKPLAIPQLEEQIKGINTISYQGFYKSPDELNELYNPVDIVWAAYPYSDQKDGNWRYARTIRFYEALAFGRPVIVQKGTPQEEDVKRYNIGLVIDMGHPNETIDAVLGISDEDLILWKKNIRNLRPNFYYHETEYAQLLHRIQSKIEK